MRDCLQSTRAIGMTDVLSPSQVRAFSDCEVRCHGLSKTMMAQNICHAAVLAGHSVLFRSAAALLEVRRGPKNYASYYRDWNHNYQGGSVATFFPFSMPGRLFAATYGLLAHARLVKEFMRHCSSI